MRNRHTWLPALAGPLLVVLGLTVLHSAPLVFACYHVVLCLAVPAWMSRSAGLSLSAHMQALGLARRGLQTGLALGLVSALAPPGLFLLAPALFPDAVRLRAALVDWGLEAAAPAGFLFFLALVNGPAEELFWRGWLLRSPSPGRGQQGLLAVLFTSYHAVTIGRLAPTVGAGALLLTGVLGAALLWTWSRARWQSVWPALLSHTGATCGYLFVCARLLDAT
jgi:membrane protease YdiL (CAAX protease family)